jgi:hypothetical protein
MGELMPMLVLRLQLLIVEFKDGRSPGHSTKTT